MLFRLKFPSLEKLNAFVPYLGHCYKVVNRRTLIIVCDCAEETVELAVEVYGALPMVLEH